MISRTLKPLLTLALASPLLTLSTSAAVAHDGVQHLHFRYGPIDVKPGANLIKVGAIDNAEKPAEDGFITGISPNLKREDGTIPRVDILHLHHGVWLNVSQRSLGGSTFSGTNQFFATGEEKTKLRFPAPYGHAVRGDDRWLMNHMIHNLTTRPDRVYITYDVDFVPKDSALARTMKAVHPIWNDVQNNHIYPVYDVHRHAGDRGRHTYPNDAPNAYQGGAPLNEWTSPQSGTLVAAWGHVHPGGLYTDLDLVRPGAKPARAARGAKGPIPGSVPHSVRIYRSTARYWDPAGPVSWDMAMTATPTDWRVRVRRGDKLRITSTYETRRSSWYEAMGIIVAYMADDATGVDPFRRPVPMNGPITHGHLPENDNHGGQPTGLNNAAAMPAGLAPGNTVSIKGFKYLPGDLSAAGDAARPPAVPQGQPLTFQNDDPVRKIFHSITACRAPCTGRTGIAYPLADGAGFDSGQLGMGAGTTPPAAGRATWQTPKNLKPGTYTYFCRVHPFMRGAFRVVSR